MRVHYYLCNKRDKTFRSGLSCSRDHGVLSSSIPHQYNLMQEIVLDIAVHSLSLRTLCCIHMVALSVHMSTA